VEEQERTDRYKGGGSGMSENKTNIKCVFCNSVLSDVTIEDIFASEGCDTCGYGAEVGGTVIIRCDKCDKVIYKKEFTNYPHGGGN
jgi:phage FluMu protein Com